MTVRSSNCSGISASPCGYASSPISRWLGRGCACSGACAALVPPGRPEQRQQVAIQAVVAGDLPGEHQPDGEREQERGSTRPNLPAGTTCSSARRRTPRCRPVRRRAIRGPSRRPPRTHRVRRRTAFQGPACRIQEQWMNDPDTTRTRSTADPSSGMATAPCQKPRIAVTGLRDRPRPGPGSCATRPRAIEKPTKSRIGSQNSPARGLLNRNRVKVGPFDLDVLGVRVVPKAEQDEQQQDERQPEGGRHDLADRIPSMHDPRVERAGTGALPQARPPGRRGCEAAPSETSALSVRAPWTGTAGARPKYSPASMSLRPIWATR